MVIRRLNDEKNKLLSEGKTADAVDDVLIKVGTDPQKNYKVIRDER